MTSSAVLMPTLDRVAAPTPALHQPHKRRVLLSPSERIVIDQLSGSSASSPIDHEDATLVVRLARTVSNMRDAHDVSTLTDRMIQLGDQLRTPAASARAAWSRSALRDEASALLGVFAFHDHSPFGLAP